MQEALPWPELSTPLSRKSSGVAHNTGSRTRPDVCLQSRIVVNDFHYRR